VGYNAAMLGHAWLRLVAALLVYLIGATPSAARRLDAPPPDVQLHTDAPHAERFERRDGPTCTAHVVPTPGDDELFASAASIVPLAWSTKIVAAPPALTRTLEPKPRGRVLPRGPPRASLHA
jgi:hypothetical protein